MADEIIRELWAIKDTIANEYNCDVKALAAYLRAKKHEADERVVDLRSIRQPPKQQAQGDQNHAGVT